MTIYAPLHRFVAPAALALVVNSPVNAAGLVDDGAAKALFLGSLSQELVKATGINAASIRAGGFASALLEALAAPSDQTRIVDYPKPATVEHLRVTAVVPTKGLEHLPIPVCAERLNKVVGVWTISPKGEVMPLSWSGARESDSPTSAACRSFILFARTELSARAAQLPAPPASAARSN